MAYLSFVQIAAGTGSRLVFRPIYPQIVTDTAVKTGTGGIDPVKPTGLPWRKSKPPEKLEQRTDDVAEIHREAREQAAREFFAEPATLETPIQQLSMAEINFEIGYLMHKQLRTQEDELMLLLLMAAAAQ